jgi:hypothetical protein
VCDRCLRSNQSWPAEEVARSPQVRVQTQPNPILLLFLFHPMKFASIDHQPINRINQSTNESTNQPINQSINQPTNARTYARTISTF